MVLASGCGSKTLVRIGGGNLKSLVVLFVLALAAFATLRGVTAVARVATRGRAWPSTLPAGQDLPSLLAAATGALAPTLALRARRRPGPGAGRPGRCRGPKGAAPTCCSAGLGIGAVIVGVWWVSGRLGFVAEHPKTLEEAFLGHQLAAHGVAELRRAGRLHAWTG